MDFSTPLKNARHEKFVLGLLAGKTADQAHTDAGYTPNRHNVARLNTNEYIQGRLGAFQRYCRCIDRTKADIKALADRLETALPSDAQYRSLTMGGVRGIAN